MELPKPPEDPDQKNIIDKLANFVARNGPEFENMTKQKQQDNPKFGFLFGGEFYNYYQYKVQSEQANASDGCLAYQVQGQSNIVINVQNKKLQEQAQQQQQQQQQHQQLQPPQLVTPQPPPHLAINPLGGPPPVSGSVIPPPQVTPWQTSGPPTLSSAPLPLQQTAPIMQQPTPVQTQIQTPQQQQVAQHQQQISLLQTQIQQQTQLNEQQIKQSEQNLAAQYQSMMQQQQVQIEESIFNTQAEQLSRMSEENQISLDDLNKTVQPIIESCTKDAILSGKSWIFQHCTNETQSQLISQYLAKRILAKDASFELRLHLIYLINDLLHHCQRKNAGNLKASLEKIVVPVFCTALVGAGEDKKVKLNKLLTLWEQNKYFDQDTIEKMKEPDKSLSEYHADLISSNGGIVTQISGAVQMQYQSLQKQHQDFTVHLQSQLQQLQSQLSQLQTQLAQAQAAVITQSISGTQVVSTAAVDVTPPTSILHKTEPEPPFQPGFSQPPPFGPPPPGFNRPPPGPGPGPGPGPAHGPGPIPQPPFDYPGPGPWQGPPPPGSAPPRFALPDLSKPPPGFPPQGMPAIPPPDIDLTPSVPYYELPAGLMAPLVKLEDHDYRSLNPKDIRLPPPMPPSERLLAAVEAFYSPPFHDRPRDSEGWEKLGLYEFFKAKQKAKKLKEERSRSKSSSQSRSRSRSKSRSPSRSPPRRRRYNSRSRSRSRSGSAPRKQSRSRSRSPSDSRSPLPYKRASRSVSPPPQPQRRRSRSASRSRSRSRSATPPNFSTEAFLAAAAAANTTDKLGEENKGHMLLKKMGWSGKGLGAKEQGIVNPIEAGEVRDRQDKFKGIGVDNSDPFEQFRKNKSQGFISRMQARDEMRKEGSGKHEKKRKGDN